MYCRCLVLAHYQALVDLCQDLVSSRKPTTPPTKVKRRQHPLPVDQQAHSPHRKHLCRTFTIILARLKRSSTLTDGRLDRIALAVQHRAATPAVVSVLCLALELVLRTQLLTTAYMVAFLSVRHFLIRCHDKIKEFQDSTMQHESDRAVFPARPSRMQTWSSCKDLRSIKYARDPSL